MNLTNITNITDSDLIIMYAPIDQPKAGRYYAEELKKWLTDRGLMQTRILVVGHESKEIRLEILTVNDPIDNMLK